MKLYHDPSATTCRPIMLFVAEQGVEIEHEHVQIFAAEHLKPSFAEVNPNQAVPVLLDGDFKLTECSAILKYLADQLGSKDYPADLRQRARVNAAMDWFNTGFYRDFGYGLVYSQILPNYAPPASARAELLAIAMERSIRWLNILEGQISANGGPYLLGGSVTLADYLGACYLTLGELIEIDLSRWQKISGWIAEMKSRPSWHEANAAFHGWSSAMRAQAA